MNEQVINPLPVPNRKGVPSSHPDLHNIYMVNPVISCRVEGKDGAILYNPDIDDFLLINNTGLLIWNFLKESHTIDEMSEFLNSMLKNAPSNEEINHDISIFIIELIPDYLIEGVSEQS